MLLLNGLRRVNNAARERAQMRNNAALERAQTSK